MSKKQKKQWRINSTYELLDKRSIPKEDQGDFRKIQLGLMPRDQRFFIKIIRNNRYRSTLIEVLQRTFCAQSGTECLKCRMKKCKQRLLGKG